METSPIDRSRLVAEVGRLLDRGSTAADVVDLLMQEGWLPPEPAAPRTDVLQGVLRDGRRVPVRVQHSLLTGTTVGSI